jgi:hypothetical protein
LQLAGKNPRKESAGISYSFEGDINSIGEAKNLIKDADNKSLIKDTRPNPAIIVCEGKNLSFKEIIDRMASSPGRNYRIHAYTSSSIVGSNSSASTGEVISFATIKE